jgi:hypothetical protein
LGDVAFIDKTFIYGPPPANIKNPTAVGANNPVKFWTYVFIPKNIDYNKLRISNSQSFYWWLNE